jgi:hypothetical protein
MRNKRVTRLEKTDLIRHVLAMGVEKLNITSVLLQHMLRWFDTLPRQVQEDLLASVRIPRQSPDLTVNGPI